jgi:hypothetical protein
MRIIAVADLLVGAAVPFGTAPETTERSLAQTAQAIHRN